MNELKQIDDISIEEISPEVISFVDKTYMSTLCQYITHAEGILNSVENIAAEVIYRKDKLFLKQALSYLYQSLKNPENGTLVITPRDAEEIYQRFVYWFDFSRKFLEED